MVFSLLGKSQQLELHDIGAAPTHVFSLINEGAKHRKVPLVLIIPGTPGICHFYVPFASKLFCSGQGKFDVCVISNAGHSPGHYKDTTIKDSDFEDTDWYTIQDQVLHKLTFIKEKASDRDSIILIGHSAGCLIVLNMLQHLNPEKVKKVFLLFPTIERLSQTAKAKSYTSYLWSSLQTPFLGMLWLTSKLMPSILKAYLCSVYFYDTPPEHLKSIIEGINIVDEKCMYNQLQTARHELPRVNDPPLDVIGANIDKIVFFYAMADPWNVESCYKDMLSRYPDKEIHLCPHNFTHAFVENSSNEMAELVFSKL